MTIVRPHLVALHLPTLIDFKLRTIFSLHALIEPMPCGSEYPGAPPCPQVDATTFVFLAFCVLLAMLVVGLYIDIAMHGRRMRGTTRAGLRAAAERISVALRPLRRLEGDELERACRFIAADLVTLLEFSIYETQPYCTTERPDDEEVRQTVYRACKEAIEIRLQLKRALFLLNFKSQRDKAHLLILEGVERYVSRFTPAVQQLHRKDTEWQRRVHVFDIDGAEQS